MVCTKPRHRPQRWQVTAGARHVLVPAGRCTQTHRTIVPRPTLQVPALAGHRQYHPPPHVTPGRWEVRQTCASGGGGNARARAVCTRETCRGERGSDEREAARGRGVGRGRTHSAREEARLICKGEEAFSRSNKLQQAGNPPPPHPLVPLTHPSLRWQCIFARSSPTRSIPLAPA
jgi:hypothetical protein